MIDKYPKLFSAWSQLWVSNGFEVHILTGQEQDRTEEKVREFGVVFTHFHSIVDWHQKLGTHMWMRNDKKGWWMERETWLETKGGIADGYKLDIHFDDQIEYAEFFPKSCTFVWVRDNFDAVCNGIFCHIGEKQPCPT